ncbi:non-LTR retroelement reverse transcriptase-like [Senna tora]|uniref:Non-LTR retroelement reverse transcriptase-like n=1 Tax=Senna tora TaxID=362788 RepID=A0A834XF80_9FABA|nr:non-LTR retroelement reverse transcriptase-like [Senna tora]
MRAACGGIVRDHDGNFIVGFMRNMGCAHPFKQLWGVYSGLVTAWQYGLFQVVVEIDSLESLQFKNHKVRTILERLVASIEVDHWSVFVDRSEKPEKAQPPGLQHLITYKLTHSHF